MSSQSSSAPVEVSASEPRLVPLVLFLVVVIVYAATIAHDLVSVDVWATDFGSWHLSHTGNPWIEGQRIPLLDDNPLRSQWVVDTHGHSVIARSPGAIAAALPVYAVLGGSFSSLPGSLTAALLAACSVLLMFLALRSRLSQRDALLAAGVFGFATPVWSVAANGLWPHTVTVLGICGMAWASATGRWWLTGVFGGVTLWGRLHAAVIPAGVGLLVAWRRRDWRFAFRVAVPSAAFLGALCAYTRWMYGTWNPAGSYSRAVITEHAQEYRFSLVNQLGLWISPDRGVLVWTPVILILLPALVRSWRDLPDWSRALVWSGLVYTTLGGALDTFTGGDVFYGYRYGLEALACATPALAMATPRMGPLARQLLGPVLAVQFLAIALGATRDHLWLTEAQAWHRNAFVSVVANAGPVGWATVGLAALLGVLEGEPGHVAAAPPRRPPGSARRPSQPKFRPKPITATRRCRSLR